jgi:hypothetical protein
LHSTSAGPGDGSVAAGEAEAGDATGGACAGAWAAEQPTQRHAIRTTWKTRAGRMGEGESCSTRALPASQKVPKSLSLAHAIRSSFGKLFAGGDRAVAD